MGSDSNISCKTCKIEYYLGYGGGRTEEDRIQRFPAQDHVGHDVTRHYSTDYMFEDEKTGNLMIDGMGWADDVVFIEGYRDFKFISFEPSPRLSMLNRDSIDKFEEDSGFLCYRVLQGDPSLSQECKDKFSDLFGKWEYDGHVKN